MIEPELLEVPQQPSVHVDVIRPADLVALSVDAVGCELVTDNDEPAHLRPITGFAHPRLVVRYSFQHTAEEAIFEGKVGQKIPVPNELEPWKPPTPAPIPSGNDPDARPYPPVGARAARGSRLVFAIPAGETIEFSSDGILAAMGRLELLVHKLALPGDAQAAGKTGHGRTLIDPDLHPVVVLPGNLIGKVSGNSIEVSKASAKLLREMGVPPPESLAGIEFLARELRRTRTLLQTRTATAVRGTTLPDHPLLRPGDLVNEYVKPPRRTPKLSYPPKQDETAIEAPYRLVISPGSEARWAHVNVPCAAANAPHHIELWHSRLGNAGKASDGTPAVDEHNTVRRIVRAIWTRDRDTMAQADWQNPTSANPGHSNNDPFLTSLDPADRHMLVRQSSESLAGLHGHIEPLPIAARSLWLSGLGAWLDLHGAWTTKPYSEASIRSILSWDHIAPLGRDQYVRVVYPGYLYPWGHQAALVKVTERKMKDAAPSVAGLYQRKFLVIGEPVRSYANRRDLPFTEVAIRPLITPVLDEPSGVKGDNQDDFFWPKIGGQAFAFVIDALDHEGRTVRLQMPLMWVAEHFNKFADIDKAYDPDPRRKVTAYGQQVAFAPVERGGDTVLAAAMLAFQGKAALGTSTPRMTSAEVLIPAVQQLSPAGPVPIAYHPAYKKHGFNGTANTGQLWARVLVQGEQTPEHATDPTVPLPLMRFGEGAPSSSDKAGGFLTPNVPIRGLSRITGTVGDVTGMATQTFDPKTYFKDSAPKLFGLIDLDDIAVMVDSDLLRMPKIISELVGRVEALIADIGRAAAAVADAVAEADRMAERAVGKPAELQAAAQAAIDAADAAKGTFADLEAQLPNLLALMQSKGKTDAAVKALYATFKTMVEDTASDFEDLADKLPPYMANVIRAMATMLRTVILKSLELFEDIYNYVNGLAESGTLARIRFEWKPEVASWPDETDPLLRLKKDSLVFAVQGQTGLDGKAKLEALAELRDFTLHLFPKAELLALKFDHFTFKSGTAGKPEVDVVLNDITFKGVLSFVEGIKDLIPLDGFSDPPMLKVTPEGMSAGFMLALPDLALGMFSISNLSLNADVQVPFIGKAVTVGFGFCTRERPFTIAVAFLGGGGWIGMRASAKGLDVLEIGLEAGACIAVNFGVASGSVSAMVGVYIRLESEAGSITGYFRIRGEVDVLGLISAAIELYMELMYQPPTGKLVGQASITVNVSVIGISKSVRISAQRVFSGSNGDPSFLQIMDAGSGTSAAWTTYCLAFKEE
ncbi:hypothetical protein HIV01_005075 [Lysobacter arenosi]|uniref:Uncharacterized protein n=1 Tax=Lysobacter arenosi TaxID=2795387 RepID=A0ABX7REI2_9GAMM|nr:hypothetical protein [Lysobacter arenosi]QSX75883.1 hypothetical protein HIV01_005075 [Lysobacter arenosi]